MDGNDWVNKRNEYGDLPIYQGSTGTLFRFSIVLIFMKPHPTPFRALMADLLRLFSQEDLSSDLLLHSKSNVQ